MSEAHAEVAGRYRLLQRIGAGGMGVVWRGYDERLGRDVAVKRLLPGAGAGVDEAEAEVASRRAMREARITARLHHPHAVPVFDVVEHEGQPCLVMEYFPSSSLADLAASGQQLSVEEVARIGGEVASALAAAHRVGIVHRDVKPGNVLVAPDGTAKISDFGISHALGDVSLTSTGLVTGTPAYLAPEVARGEPATAASDVFSLGSTLYSALEGHPPFGSHENPMAVLHRVASGEVDPPARSGRLTGLLLRMLAAAPADRPTMAEVARQLSDEPGDRHDLLWPFRDGATAAEEPEAGESRRSRRRVLVAVGALTVLAVAVVAVLLGRGADPITSAAATPTRTPATTAATTAAPSSSPTPSTPSPRATTAPPSSTPAPSPSPSPSTPRPRPSRSAPAPASGGTPTAGQLRDALGSYYALLPGDRDAGWDRLTALYQRTTARNRDYYDSFWGAVRRVRLSDVTASPPETVTATVTYDYDDGRTFVERTRYRLVQDDGTLKVDRSEVLSSVQR